MCLRLWHGSAPSVATMNSDYEIFATFLSRVERTLTRSGVDVDNISYFCDELAQWVATRPRVDVIPDPRDVSFVLVRTPLGNLVKASATTPGIKAWSSAEWRAHRRAEIALSKSPDLVAQADQSLERRDLTVAEAKRRRGVKRRRATAAAGDGFRSPSTPTPPAQPLPHQPLATKVGRAEEVPTPQIYELEEYMHDN